MADLQSIGDNLQQFVDSVGVYFDRFNAPRICGRIVGLLMVAEQPLSLDDMAAALHISRGSASTNIRLAMQLGLAELVSLPGDRRDYYSFTANAWERYIGRNLEVLARMRSLAEVGLAALAPYDEVGRERLEEMLEYCVFADAELNASLARWRERRAARARARAEAGRTDGRWLDSALGEAVS